MRVFALCAAALALLVAPAAQVSAQTAQTIVGVAHSTVYGDFNDPGPRLNVSFVELQGVAGVNITVTLLKTIPPQNVGFHVHQFGDQIETASPNGAIINATYVGSHFNPAGSAHGCYPSDTRHVGDIGNLTIIDGQNTAGSVYTFQRDLMTLFPSVNSIIGRSLVMHYGPDTCGQPTGNAGNYSASGVIGIANIAQYAPQFTGAVNGAGQDLTQSTGSELGMVQSVVAYYHPLPQTATTGASPYGFMYITPASGFGTSASLARVQANLTGATPNTVHGFHLHTYGDDSTMALAGPHYNPFNASHGYPLTSAGTYNDNRHMGDLGNVTSDANGNIFFDMTLDLIQLIGTTNIVGRSAVIHNGQDNGVLETSSGARLSSGVFGISKTVPAGDTPLGFSSTGGGNGGGASSSSTGPSGPPGGGGGGGTGAAMAISPAPLAIAAALVLAVLAM